MKNIQLYKSVSDCRKYPVALLLAMILPATIYPQKGLHRVQVNSVQEMQDYFRYTPDRIPHVSSHRGGAMKGYPENCIATFEHTLSVLPTFFEVDPRLTKDSVVVVMHDATLDRTTNGKGKLSDHTWEEVKKLRLKDPEGNLTGHAVPTLDEVLNWARGKTMLMLDKKDVPLPLLLKKINEHHAEGYVLVSSYDVKEAAFYHRNNPDIFFEAFIRNEKEMHQYDSAGIPWKNIVAYVGKPRKKELYGQLHAKGVMCIVYTAKNIERLPEKEARIEAYKKVIRTGGDIILADKVFEVGAALQPLRPVGSSKDKYFHHPAAAAQ